MKRPSQRKISLQSIQGHKIGKNHIIVVIVAKFKMFKFIKINFKKQEFFFSSFNCRLCITNIQPRIYIKYFTAVFFSKLRLRKQHCEARILLLDRLLYCHMPAYNNSVIDFLEIFWSEFSGLVFLL